MPHCISIVGPGALGLSLATVLKRAGASVSLIDHRAERAELLNRQGIIFEGGSRTVTTKIPVLVGIDQIPLQTALVIVAVKATKTESVARALASSGYRGAILTLQNGIGNLEIIQKHLPKATLMAGTTSEGATLIDHGYVKHYGEGLTKFGPTDHRSSNQVFLESLLTLFRKAGLSTEIVFDLEKVLWEKLLVNAGINPVTAILQIENGKILQVDAAYNLMVSAIEEGLHLAEIKGLSLYSYDPVSVAETVCRKTKENRSSMCQDLAKGRPTEIDFINGAIVREGRSAGVECPNNEALVNLVHSLEQTAYKNRSLTGVIPEAEPFPASSESETSWPFSLFPS